MCRNRRNYPKKAGGVVNICHPEIYLFACTVKFYFRLSKTGILTIHNVFYDLYPFCLHKNETYRTLDSVQENVTY